MNGPQRLLRSLLGGGTAYLALFVVVHVVLALTSGGTKALNVVALVLVIVPQWILIRRSTLELPPGLALLIGVLACAAAVVGLLSIRNIAQPGGYDAWFLGGIAFDLLGLTVVGRFSTAWITMVVIVAACILWAVLGDRPVLVGVGLIVRHVATLAVGTALAVSLRRSNAASSAFRAVQRRRRMEEDVGRARAGARRSAVEQVLEQAGPTLRAIAEGRSFTHEDRRQMLVLEGALRDQMRAPRLNASELRNVTDRARRRGVNVLLLDEAEEAEQGFRAQAVQWLAARLEQTAEGRFVGRLRDHEGGGVRVSAVGDDAGETRVFAPPGSTDAQLLQGPPMPDARGAEFGPVSADPQISYEPEEVSVADSSRSELPDGQGVDRVRTDGPGVRRVAVIAGADDTTGEEGDGDRSKRPDTGDGEDDEQDAEHGS